MWRENRGDSAVKKSELENWSKGIAYNYEGPEVLERQAYRVSNTVRSPLWLAVTFVPFLGFITLLVFTRIRQKQLADPDGLKSRKALSRFNQRVRAIGAEGGSHSNNACAVLLEAIRAYLGDKLRSDGSALTLCRRRGKTEGKGGQHSARRAAKKSIRCLRTGKLRRHGFGQARSMSC